MSKIIIVGPGGIGASIARKLAGQGAGLHLISRAPENLAREIGASFTSADVTNAPALEGAVRAAGEAVDGLCYSVGTINLKPIGRLTDQEIIRDFEVNALSALRAIKAALPALKASKLQTSSILLFSTVAVAQGFASHASVAMAKGAIEGLTLALAAELAPKIRVNCIAPSLTRTPLANFITSNEPTTTAIAGMHALQRIGDGEDISALGALLLSPDAGWITGQIIGVDGGRSSLRTKG